jgi:peptidoglycan/xylan/chitin deacetylase (PgdA/CDA1 family)
MPERADNSPRWILRRVVKTAMASALQVSGVQRVVRSVRRRAAGGTRVLVLSYHRVTDDFAESARDGLPSLLVSTATLRRQLEQVARERDLVSLAEARRILAEGPDAAPRGRDVAVVTFDDGYADNHASALPILAALRVPATVFVATGYTGTERRLPHDRIHAALSELGRRGIPPDRAGLAPDVQGLLDACNENGPAATLDRLIARLGHDRLVAVAEAVEQRIGRGELDLPPGTRLMSWDEVRALDAAGVDVGGHTVNHAVLANLSLPEARREIVGCRDALAEALGRAPRHFAYPNGYHTPAVRRAVAEAGFEAAVTTEDVENVRGGDPHRLSRKVLWENTTLGPIGYSPSVASCNLEGVFQALGLSRPVMGERPDALAEATVRAGREGADERDPDHRAAS